MALNFTVSYTFSPGTTIASSQVNTNTSDVAAVFQGLEAETKTLAKLKMDADPTIALEVATKQYVDHYSAYRRPVLVYNSSAVVNIETGLNGTSGAATILFPDGSVRTDSTTSRIQCSLSQNAVLSGTAQGGLRTGSAANNTFYMVYAVKVSDSSTNFVAVADVVTPVQSNFATLNVNFGTNSWVYLGTVCRGDAGSSGTSIVPFIQQGNITLFNNTGTGASTTATSGVILADTGGAATLVWTWASGITLGSGQVPAHLKAGWVTGAAAAVASGLAGLDSGGNFTYGRVDGTVAGFFPRIFVDLTKGFKLANGASTSIAYTIVLAGFVDSVLGVGSNPML